jgi:hypothetical protein
MGNVDKILLTYAGADMLFVLGGVVLLVASLVLKGRTQDTLSLDTAPDMLLFRMLPFEGFYPYPSLFLSFFLACFLFAYRSNR